MLAQANPCRSRCIDPFASFALTLFALVASGSCAVHAATLLVPQQFTSIQAAINAAVSGDLIVLADGTYTGDENVNLDFAGKSITLRSAGGAAACTIDIGSGPNFLRRAFVFQNQESDAAVVDGISMINGLEYFGGAILCTNDSRPTIRNCIFRNNLAYEDGGAIACIGSSPTIVNCHFQQNMTSLNGCFQRHCCGRGTGGAIACVASGPQIIGCRVIANRSLGSGGGISVEPDDPNDAVPPVAITPTIANCLLVGNVAMNGDGGGLALYAGTPVVRNCTIAGNAALCPGGGIANVFNVTLTLRDSIVRDNFCRLDGDDMTVELGAHLDGDYCIAGTAPNLLFVDQQSTLAWGAHNIDSPAGFISTPDAGEDGRWGTADDVLGDLHLLASSAAIDAGDPGVSYAADAADLDGRLRVWDGDGIAGARIDIGAFEFDSALPGDLDHDCDVDLQDLATLLSHFGTIGGVVFESGDADRDGDVDLQDLALLLARFGGICVWP